MAAILSRPQFVNSDSVEVYVCVLCFYVIAFYISFRVTQWGQVTHICVSALSIIVPDNG